MLSATIWCVVLSIPFLLAFIAVPLWMSVRYPDRAPDHTAARLYLALKEIPAARVAPAEASVARA